MLVLSRKINEQIVIEGNITITVVDIRGDKVRLGIEAPMEVPVHRGEVHDAICRSMKEHQAVLGSDDASVSAGATRAASTSPPAANSPTEP